MIVTIGGVEFTGKAAVLALILLAAVVGAVLLIPDIRAALFGFAYDFAR